MAAWPYNTTAWQALRMRKLSEQPLCEACLRREVVEPANTVDHITAINAGGEPFPPLSGLMSMCAPCHNAKTAAIDTGRASGFRRRFKGYDAEGNPLSGEGWTEPERLGAAQGLAMTRAGPPAPIREYIVSYLLMNNHSSFNNGEQSWA